MTKKFDDPKARAFVNGVLNSIKNEIEKTGAEPLVANCEAALAEAQAKEEAEVAVEEETSAETEATPTQENEEAALYRHRYEQLHHLRGGLYRSR